MRILVAVDVQNDFISGSLAVPHANDIIAPLLQAANAADLVIATADWHPANHGSFDVNGGPWPVHCVQGSDGAKLHPSIEAVADIIFHKGMDVDNDGYSAFSEHPMVFDHLLGVYEEDDPTASANAEVLIGGLALDFCVLATALDAHSYGHKPKVLGDATTGVTDETSLDALDQLRAAGIEVVLTRGALA